VIRGFEQRPPVEVQTKGIVSVARVTVAERGRLSWLLVRRGLRRASGRVNNFPLLPWRLIPRKADRLLLSPQDLRTADGTRASEIYSGRFAFAGKVVSSTASAGCGICAPSIRRSLEPMPAPWWTNGSRCRAAGMPWPGARKS
jgi:hypothetical protein